MKRIIVLLLILAWTGLAFAEELRFPTTEEEIVKGLSLDGGSGLIGGAAPLEEKAVRVGALVLFDLDSDRIKAESHGLLDEFGRAMNGGLSDAKIVIAGHTDSTGDRAYNNDLSLRRAMSVKDYLVVYHNIAESRLGVQGYGEDKPIADNGTSRGRALNRRVEFIRLTEGW